MLEWGYVFKKDVLGTLQIYLADCLKHNRLCFKGCHCVNKRINVLGLTKAGPILLWHFFPFSSVSSK